MHIIYIIIHVHVTLKNSLHQQFQYSLKNLSCIYTQPTSSLPLVYVCISLFISVTRDGLRQTADKTNKNMQRNSVLYCICISLQICQEIKKNYGNSGLLVLVYCCIAVYFDITFDMQYSLASSSARLNPPKSRNTYRLSEIVLK